MIIILSNVAKSICVKFQRNGDGALNIGERLDLCEHDITQFDALGKCKSGALDLGLRPRPKSAFNIHL